MIIKISTNTLDFLLNYRVIWRYDSEGNLDKTFGNNGIVVHHNAAGSRDNDGGNSIYVDGIGRFYVT